MSSTFAVITDIHGNSPALQAVLQSIDHQTEAQHIYCLGDMVGIGPDTNEVLERLFERDDVSMITGNHEDVMLSIYRGEELPYHGPKREHHKWIYQHTSEAFFPMLEALPRSMKTEYDGKQILFVHYHMDQDGNYLPVDRAPSVEKLDDLYRDNEAELVCFGHHHPVHFFESTDRIYVNPGSLGCCECPVARYAVVRVSSRKIEVELRGVTYDNDDFLRSYEELDIPARELIVRAFHGNQTLQVSHV